MKKKVIAFALAALVALGVTPVGQISKVEAATAAKDSKIHITYTNWNLGTEKENNMERRMIGVFNQRSKTTVIDIKPISGDYMKGIATLASSGQLPDVFMIPNVPQAYGSKWAKDITEIAKADDEWSKIMPSLQDSATINDKIVAVPFAMHMYGGILNLDAFEKANVKPLKFGYTTSQFGQALKALTQPSNQIVGLKHVGNLVDILPGTSNPKVGWFTFDGTKYNLNSQDFLNAVTKTQSYNKQGYTWEGLSASEKANFVGVKGDYEAWIKGKAAIAMDGTWALGTTFKTAFVGLPNGTNALIPDFAIVSSTSKNPQEAFEALKWMTYSSEGFLKRIDIAKTVGTKYFSMPFIDNDKVDAAFAAYCPVPGLQDCYKAALKGKALVEPYKTVAGYPDSRFTATTGLKVADKANATVQDIIDLSVQGKINYADYAAQLNKLANDTYQKALKAIN